MKQINYSLSAKAKMAEPSFLPQGLNINLDAKSFLKMETFGKWNSVEFDPFQIRLEIKIEGLGPRAEIRVP